MESYLARFAERLERELPTEKSSQHSHTQFMLHESLRVLYQIVAPFARHWLPEDRAYIEDALADRVRWGMKGCYVQRVVTEAVTEVAKNTVGEIDLQLALKH